MGKVTVKEQAGNKQKLVLRAARVREWIKSETKQRLTHDHEGEQVSIKKVPNDWLVPGFYTHHSSDQVNQWDCLKGNIKTLKSGWFRLQSDSTCVRWGLPLGWCRIPRAETGCRCCISPNVTGWRRTAPPTVCNRVWSHSRHSPHAQIWSTRWPRKTRTPSCPDRGQTAPPVAWRSWCGEPAYRPHRLHNPEKTGIVSKQQRREYRKKQGNISGQIASLVPVAEGECCCLSVLCVCL